MRLSTSEPHHDGAIRDEGDYDGGSSGRESRWAARRERGYRLSKRRTLAAMRLGVFEPLGGARRARLSAVEAKNLGVDPLGDVGGPGGVIPDLPRNVERSVWRPEK